MTNEDHLDQWRDHEWWPAIEEAHKSLLWIEPGYRITQIKEKFGGLRYYFDLPEGSEAYESANMAVARSEGWVQGYEWAKAVRNGNR